MENKNPYIEISNRKIGIDYPPLVVAEIGINHEGSLDTALEMVDAAHGEPEQKWLSIKLILSKMR